MGIKGGVRAEMGAFVQDRWTVNRLTVNAGLRFDYNHTGWDEYHFGPGPLVPNRNFTVEAEDFYKFKDLSPRVGVAPTTSSATVKRPSRRTSASTGWLSIRPRAFRPATGLSLA